MTRSGHRRVYFRSLDVCLYLSGDLSRVRLRVGLRVVVGGAASGGGGESAQHCVGAVLGDRRSLSISITGARFYICELSRLRR